MQSKLFRKVALDRLSSPEQLDQLMQITTPKAWFALIGLGSLLLIAGVWAIFGKIPNEVQGKGILVSQPETGGLAAVIYVDLGQGADIRPGMDVKIELSTVKPENYGYLRGRVISVGDVPVTRQDVQRVVGNEELVAAVLPDSPSVEVRLELLHSDKTRSGYKWTSQDGPPKQLAVGTPCTATVTVDEERPISRLFPVFGRLLLPSLAGNAPR
jgi:hypothetical protein